MDLRTSFTNVVEFGLFESPIELRSFEIPESSNTFIT